MIPEQMHAVAYANYGGPECLRPVLIETPKCRRGQVIIRVEAAGVNPIDARLRSGEMKWLLPGGFPRIAGYDVAGRVVQCNGVDHLQPGDRVLAYLDGLYGGGYANFAKCSGSGAVKIPESMPFEQAAAIPLAGSTAIQSLRGKGAIQRSERVLINGASGGVGAFAVQIAKAFGAEVTAIASGQHEEFVRALGADFFINYQQQDFTKQDLVWDVIFDAAGKSSFWRARRVLAKRGRYVSTEPSASGLLTTALTRPFRKRGCVMLARSNHDDLTDLVRLYSSGELKVHVHEVFPLDRAIDAHRQIERGGHCGKLVLRMQDAPN